MVRGIRTRDHLVGEAQIELGAHLEQALPRLLHAKLAQVCRSPSDRLLPRPRSIHLLSSHLSLAPLDD